MLVLVYICNYKKLRVSMERNLYAQKCLCLFIVVNPVAFSGCLPSYCAESSCELSVETLISHLLFTPQYLYLHISRFYWCATERASDDTASVLFLSKSMRLPAYVIDIFDLVGPFHSSQMVLTSLELTAGTSSRKRANLPALMCPQPCRQKRVRLPDLLLHLQVS